MKLIKRIVVALLILITVISGGGYFYFNQKFTPEENYLKVKNESGNTPVTWLGNDKNVMLLPVHFHGNSETYYLQFDTGSPYTQFYSHSIENLKQISVRNGRAQTVLHIGNTEVSSHLFKIFKTENSDQDSIKVIGTLGADILEERKTIIDFRNNFVSLNISDVPIIFKENLIDFKFKKRKIVIPGVLKGKERKFLYDSGTSAYEFLTYKEEWEKLKLKNTDVKIEKAKSWNRVLTTFTAKCNENINFENIQIPLQEITYVEGVSDAQFSLMKFTGMSGMIGNKIFLNHSIFIDDRSKKFGID